MCLKPLIRNVGRFLGFSNPVNDIPPAANVQMPDPAPQQQNTNNLQATADSFLGNRRRRRGFSSTMSNDTILGNTENNTTNQLKKTLG